MSEFDSEKDILFYEFFDIGKHPDINIRIKTITEIKRKLIELQKIKSDDYEVNCIINVIDCLLIYMIEDDTVKAREKVAHIWDTFSTMERFTLLDIRILTAILFSAKTLDEFIIVTNKTLVQLERFNDHPVYLHIKTILNYNLSYKLMKLKYSGDKQYSKTLDQLFIDTTNLTLELSMKYDSSIFGTALVRKGIIEKDNVLIYAGLKILDTPDAKEKLEYIRDYGIFFITHSNLL